MFSPDEIVPLNQVRGRMTELAEKARAGQETIITKNGEAYVALIDAHRLAHYHRLEREHIHLTLLADAEAGWDDVEAGRTMPVADLWKKYEKKTRKR
jgi:prevent-host-death family protein